MSFSDCQSLTLNVLIWVLNLSGIVKCVMKSLNHKIAVNVLSLQCSEDAEWVTISLIELSWQLKMKLKKGFNFACWAIQYPVQTCKRRGLHVILWWRHLTWRSKSHLPVAGICKKSTQWTASSFQINFKSQIQVAWESYIWYGSTFSEIDGFHYIPLFP